MWVSGFVYLHMKFICVFLKPFTSCISIWRHRCSGSMARVSSCGQCLISCGRLCLPMLVYLSMPVDQMVSHMHAQFTGSLHGFLRSHSCLVSVTQRFSSLSPLLSAVVSLPVNTPYTLSLDSQTLTLTKQGSGFMPEKCYVTNQQHQDISYLKSATLKSCNPNQNLLQP